MNVVVVLDFNIRTITEILDTISLRATSRSSVRLAPKIPNYIVHVLDYDKTRYFKSIDRD